MKAQNVRDLDENEIKAKLKEEEKSSGGEEAPKNE